MWRTDTGAIEKEFRADDFAPRKVAVNADGSQVAFWTSREDRTSTEHAHDFDEYVLVIEGRVTVLTGGGQIELRAGDEHVIPKGTMQRMAVTRGTRTMHVFGGKRAERQR